MDSTLIGIWVFVFGAIVGSFLNVVILRFNSGKTILGRSGCFSCGKTLEWHELIPVFSYLFLQGKCSRCKSRISIQYPLVELANGLLFTFLFFRVLESFPILNSSFVILIFLEYLIWTSLVVIFVYDIHHKIIPDLFSGLFFAGALGLVLFGFYESHNLATLIHQGEAMLILGGFFFALWFASSGRWMGFGDVKLALGIGLYLGISRGLSAIAFAFWIGAGSALLRMAYVWIRVRMGTNQLSSGVNTLTMKSEVPFAPFLIVGTFLALALGSDIFHITLFFNV